MNKIIGITATLLFCTACTKQIPSSYRFVQQEEVFGASSSQDVNTAIDILWVVDNSASMDVSQKKLRQGFSGFAQKYLSPNWDIRIAAITTDAYMANPAFSAYLNRTIPGTQNYKSTYLSGQFEIGAFSSGIKYGQLIPSWGPDYARLLPGVHDGPVAAECFELLPYFYNGVTQCSIRDRRLTGTDASSCLFPQEGQNSLSECVNTTRNDSVRSGYPILSTLEHSTDRLVQYFMINATTGSAGQGSERGLSSVIQFIQDNENSSTKFFRPGSLRMIVFVSDEDDQSMVLPESPSDSFSPTDGYRCDQESLLAINPIASVVGKKGYCCTSSECTYGKLGTSCEKKTVDDYTYTPSICPDPSRLIPVASIKSNMDEYFQSLGGDPNYFVISIVPLKGSTIQSMQAERQLSDTAAKGIKNHAVDRGDRYIELGNLVGNGSSAYDIGEGDYSVILAKIGEQIIQKKSSFTLAREATGSEDMIITIVHEDGTKSILKETQYQISGKELTITDSDVVRGFSKGDKISVNYQPKTAY